MHGAILIDSRLCNHLIQTVKRRHSTRLGDSESVEDSFLPRPRGLRERIIQVLKRNLLTFLEFRVLQRENQGFAIVFNDHPYNAIAYFNIFNLVR